MPIDFEDMLLSFARALEANPKLDSLLAEETMYVDFDYGLNPKITSNVYPSINDTDRCRTLEIVFDLDTRKPKVLNIRIRVSGEVVNTFGFLFEDPVPAEDTTLKQLDNLAYTIVLLSHLRMYTPIQIDATYLADQ